MNKEQIEYFKQYLADKLGFDLNEVETGSDLALDLGMDDLDFVEIIMDCEVKFSIVIDDSKADECITVSDFIEMMKTCRSSI
tara:strand:- start:54 stop:299 length:246 start_codon:yes stop_codon:yes gene_type:complete